MAKDSIVIAAENVSKKFVLQRGRAGDLREAFGSLWRKRDTTQANNAFYALRDVGFTIQRGETVGIVGHNGCGKSTLLKMLTGILKPDTGHVRTVGRVGALIEVGAGFHPDMSGRENIFLNGSIMGLSRRELATKFDAIVAFAGLERFIDTPVKRYSSGMYMRLGFAIATHVEPDILLIDEVLAVGDTQFQNKCLAHLQSFAAKGGTVVFVSHSMSQVAQLCERCLWLDRGQLLHDGATVEAIEQYAAIVAEREEEEFKRTHPEDWADREAERQAKRKEQLAEEERQRIARLNEEEQRLAEIAAQEAELMAKEAEELKKPYRQPGRSRLLGVQLSAKGILKNSFTAGEAITVSIPYRFRTNHPCPAFTFNIFREDGLYMFTTSNFDHNLPWRDLPREGTVQFQIPFLSLNEGKYRIRLALYTDWKPDDWDSVLEDVVESAATFRVDAGPFAHGCAFLPIEWEPAPRRGNEP